MRAIPGIALMLLTAAPMAEAVDHSAQRPESHVDRAIDSDPSDADSEWKMPRIVSPSETEVADSERTGFRRIAGRPQRRGPTATPHPSPQVRNRPVAPPPAASLITSEKPFAQSSSSRDSSLPDPDSTFWSPSSLSSGGHPFQTVRVGKGPFRVLLIGSLYGDDPAALALVEQLARHLDDKAIILGGFETVVVRTGNPDGLISHRKTNGRNIHLLGNFPRTATTTRSSSGTDKQPVPRQAALRQPEVVYLIELIQDFRPQRIVHVRTTSSSQGYVLHSGAAAATGKALAKWLEQPALEINGRTLNGSLERFVAEQLRIDMISIALPERTRTNDVWNRYGEFLVSLFVPGRDTSSAPIDPAAATPIAERP